MNLCVTRNEVVCFMAEQFGSYIAYAILFPASLLMHNNVFLLWLVCEKSIGVLF